MHGSGLMVARGGARRGTLQTSGPSRVTRRRVFRTSGTAPSPSHIAKTARSWPAMPAFSFQIGPLLASTAGEGIRLERSPPGLGGQRFGPSASCGNVSGMRLLGVALALDALRDALEGMTGCGPSEIPNAKRLGRALKRHVGHVLTASSPTGDRCPADLPREGPHEHPMVACRNPGMTMFTVQGCRVLQEIAPLHAREMAIAN
jgi:hypothetical protein